MPREAFDFLNDIARIFNRVKNSDINSLNMKVCNSTHMYVWVYIYCIYIYSPHGVLSAARRHSAIRKSRILRCFAERGSWTGTGQTVS